jgi:hypothetical protein
LDVLLNLGTEEDRAFYRAHDKTREDLVTRLLYPESDDLSFLEVKPEPALDRLLLREAALNNPREPHRIVLTEAAKLLARRDWTALLGVSSDFIVYLAEHDEGLAGKLASLREVNPADRASRRDLPERPSGA